MSLNKEQTKWVARALEAQIKKLDRLKLDSVDASKRLEDVKDDLVYVREYVASWSAEEERRKIKFIYSEVPKKEVPK